MTKKEWWGSRQARFSPHIPTGWELLMEMIYFSLRPYRMSMRNPFLLAGLPPVRISWLFWDFSRLQSFMSLIMWTGFMVWTISNSL